VCTADGEVIICQDSGEFKSILQDSPSRAAQKVHIISVVPFSRGLVLGGKDGEIVILDKQDDMDNPFKLMRIEQYAVERATTEKPSITSMAIISTEDKIFFTSSNNQLVEFNVSLDGIDNETSFNPVIFDFHSSKITGLDVCI
jgi:cilia- and flagella-associated protein 57